MADAFSRCFDVRLNPPAITGQLRQQARVLAITRAGSRAAAAAPTPSPAPLPTSESQVSHAAAVEAIPRIHRDNFAAVHNGIQGHRGVALTVAALRHAGADWESVRADVATLIVACSTGQKVRLRSSSDQPPPSDTAVYRAFHTLFVDFLGPFPADPEGNRFILVAVCAFTRWCCLFVMKDATASSAVTALLHVFGTFGAFRHLRSDQGPHFTAAVVAELCSALNVKQDLTIAFRPQANGIVERANGEVLRHLRALVTDFKSYDSWSTFVPLVQRLLNATPCSSTGFLPSDSRVWWSRRPESRFLRPARRVGPPARR